MSYIWEVPGYKFDLARIRKEVNEITSQFQGEPQICLTHRKSVTDAREKLFDGAGSLYCEELKSMRATEDEFTVFNDAYKDTYLYEIYQSIPDIGRFRIMIAKPFTCYSMHTDKTDRYHIAVVTNPNAYLVFPDSEVPLNWIPDNGRLYKADTKERHTAMNCGHEDRIHLLLDDIGTL